MDRGAASKEPCAMTYQTPSEELIRTDIRAYLKRHEEKDLLRFLTCGSVDDGKSTLIGRLLYDSHMIYEDQLAAVQKDSKVHGTTGDDFDPALLTDGLKAEREQGITIDVAYRYFSTDRRKFIIADCPGHEQYTRNMATGASTCNLAVILIDARLGVITQTRRHSFICSLLGIRHVIVAVNKMDLVDGSEEVYDRIREDYNRMAARLRFTDIHFIPISALKGDNVVHPSEQMPWYQGPTVLHHLEHVNIVADRNLIDFRFPVQTVLRPNLNFRGFSGTIASGVVRVGDEVMSLPSRRTSRVKSILTREGEHAEAFAPMAVTLTLEDEIDVSRGNMLVPVRNLPHVGQDFEAMLVWMHDEPASAGRSYLIKQTTAVAPGLLSAIRYKVDVNTMHRQESAAGEAAGAVELGLNEIGRVHLTVHRPLAFDAYERNRSTGAFIVIDRITNVTVGAGMILDRIVSGETRPAARRHIVREDTLVTREERRALLRQRGVTVWLTGLSGSGKSTVAKQLEQTLIQAGHAAYILDGDNIRHGLNSDLGFTAVDRSENIRRIAEVARLMNDAGLIVLTAFISPYRADREQARELIGAEAFLEVFVDTPIDICEQRDPKGLYKKARAGEIPQFTGVSDPYEAPETPALVLRSAEQGVAEEVQAVLHLLRDAGVLSA
jgi:bifunctional enzyme CysN/CysC